MDGPRQFEGMRAGAMALRTVVCATSLCVVLFARTTAIADDALSPRRESERRIAIRLLDEAQVALERGDADTAGRLARGAMLYDVNWSHEPESPRAFLRRLERTDLLLRSGAASAADDSQTSQPEFPPLLRGGQGGWASEENASHSAPPLAPPYEGGEPEPAQAGEADVERGPLLVMPHAASVAANPADVPIQQVQHRQAAFGEAAALLDEPHPLVRDSGLPSPFYEPIPANASDSAAAAPPPVRVEFAPPRERPLVLPPAPWYRQALVQMLGTLAALVIAAASLAIAVFVWVRKAGAPVVVRVEFNGAVQTPKGVPVFDDTHEPLHDRRPAPAHERAVAIPIHAAGDDPHEQAILRNVVDSNLTLRRALKSRRAA
ncbi:MAG: hypothetical protein KY476_14445 [Planctomycetes bacterium]|nr:hypothetical protein [Planctomycetota bacterium]